MGLGRRVSHWNETRVGGLSSVDPDPVCTGRTHWVFAIKYLEVWTGTCQTGERLKLRPGREVSCGRSTWPVTPLPFASGVSRDLPIKHKNTI